MASAKKNSGELVDDPVASFRLLLAEPALRLGLLSQLPRALPIFYREREVFPELLIRFEDEPAVKLTTEATNIFVNYCFLKTSSLYPMPVRIRELRRKDPFRSHSIYVVIGHKDLFKQLASLIELLRARGCTCDGSDVGSSKLEEAMGTQAVRRAIRQLCNPEAIHVYACGEPWHPSTPNDEQASRTSTDSHFDWELEQYDTTNLCVSGDGQRAFKDLDLSSLRKELFNRVYAGKPEECLRETVLPFEVITLEALKQRLSVAPWGLTEHELTEVVSKLPNPASKHGFYRSHFSKSVSSSPPIMDANPWTRVEIAGKLEALEDSNEFARPLAALYRSGFLISDKVHHEAISLMPTRLTELQEMFRSLEIENGYPLKFYSPARELGQGRLEASPAFKPILGPIEKQTRNSWPSEETTGMGLGEKTSTPSGCDTEEIEQCSWHALKSGIDPIHRSFAWLGQHFRDLTPGQLKVLKELAEANGRWVTKQQLESATGLKLREGIRGVFKLNRKGSAAFHPVTEAIEFSYGRAKLYP